MPWQFLSSDDRRALGAALETLAEFRGGSGTRSGLLNTAGLGHLLPQLKTLGNDSARAFTAELIMLAEDGDWLAEQPRIQPLGALLRHLMGLGDTPMTTVALCARLLARYVLLNDAAETARLRADYGLSDPPAPWRDTRRAGAAPNETAPVATALVALRAFKALLDEGKATLDAQNVARHRLSRLLHANHAGNIPPHAGDDDLFYKMRPVMSEDEIDLFQDVRNYTLVATYDVNRRIREWVDANQPAQLFPQPTRASQRLETQLTELKAHLNLWFARYRGSFADDPRRALVFLGDEKRRGKQWPYGLNSAVKAALAELEGG